MAESHPRRANRLAQETSPYLLQHRFNPVDWQPWGEAALEQARREDKPIFLSIGYSSCHWCHVMERESFENDAIARELNENFVSIKVDREERPDLDEIYMKAVQLMTGGGGWPMSVFLTPKLQPFYGGTYYPPDDRYGRPGFLALLKSIHGFYRQYRGRVDEQAAQLTAKIAEVAAAAPPREKAAADLLQSALEVHDRVFDERDGGFGDAPKFPHSMSLALLLRLHVRQKHPRALAMARFSLERMARGGIYDQLAGGFHRYSTDERWLVPHFEKMLYDNALLAPVYAEAAVVTGEPLFARVARGTCDYVLREMTSPEGGFHSATDADSEGEEGRFFVWDEEEIARELGRSEAAAFCAFFGVERGGNFEHGKSILWQKGDETDRARFAGAIERLLAARARRVPPLLDDKVLCEWNGLMIAGLARCGALLDEPRYVAAAARAARFVLDRMRAPDGRLLRTHRGGTSRVPAFLPDYADLAHGLFELAAADADPRWAESACELTRRAATLFAAPGGGYQMTPSDGEALLAASRDPFDNATPSGNSIMALDLLRLADLEGDAAAEAQAIDVLESFAALMRESPPGFGQMLQALDLALHPRTTVVLAGRAGDPELRAMQRVVHGALRPGVQVVVTDGSDRGPALLRGKAALDGRATAWVCSGRTCREPARSADALRAQLA